MPEDLHAELSRASERQGMSLNAFITSTLAAAVGRKDAAPPGRQPKRTTPAAQPSRRRTLELLLVANLVVVGAVGVLAAVLLVRALS